MIKYYTGVGSHKVDEIPPEVLRDALIIAKILEAWGFHLRSGGAPGLDQAFEHGVSNAANMTIYSKDTNINVSKEIWDKSVEIALRDHPYPQNAMLYIKWIGRNPFQVLGENLDSPSLFLICWTANGEDIGGTGTTMRVATRYNVPIYNLHNLRRDQILTDINAKYVDKDE